MKILLTGCSGFIGPSTESSIPNYGLCEFKESIGCEINQKFTFSKEI